MSEGGEIPELVEDLGDTLRVRLGLAEGEGLRLLEAGPRTIILERVSGAEELPCSGPPALRTEIADELDQIFTLWLERAADQRGPRSTAFLAQRFDILTGEPGERVSGGHNIFFDLLMFVFCIIVTWNYDGSILITA